LTHLFLFYNDRYKNLTSIRNFIVMHLTIKEFYMENSYSPESSGASSTKNQGSWYAILAVAIGAFALVTSEFLPVGVLNSVAADLNISIGTAGLIITLPGVMAAFAAPFSRYQ
jgi:hypothetical protein